jgi:DNA-binding CsgD family transcriptional regulator
METLMAPSRPLDVEVVNQPGSPSRAWVSMPDRWLAKSEAASRFRDLEEAAELSQREVRAGTRDAFGEPVMKRARPPRPRNMTFADRVKPDTDAIVAAYRDDGLTVPEISKVHGISQHTVYRHLKLAGVPLRAKTALPEEAELVRLYESGLSIRQIAKKYSASTVPVHRRLLAAGVTMRPAKGAVRSAA